MIIEVLRETPMTIEGRAQTPAGAVIWWLYLIRTSEFIDAMTSFKEPGRPAVETLRHRAWTRYDMAINPKLVREICEACDLTIPENCREKE